MPSFSPGYSLLYLFLFFNTGGPIPLLLVVVVAVLAVDDDKGSEQHKIRGGEEFLLLHFRLQESKQVITYLIHKPSKMQMHCAPQHPITTRLEADQLQTL
ncbi:hypothetical protein QYF36_016414 [Acer negundo]|nr:hypothetical protein QYF36_016414 [Acer negundo]